MPDARCFRILAVCTGNVCRSPLAERTLQLGLDYASPGKFLVRSAGTRALVGHSMTSEIRTLARDLGASDQEFVSRQLTPDMLRYADLVLTLTRAHSATILEENPLLLARTFSLREFARLLSRIEPEEALDPVARWQSAVRQVLRKRGTEYVAPGADDIVDPYRQPDEVLQQMAGQLVPAVRAIAEWELASTHDGPGLSTRLRHI